jgi:RNA polymerase sigma factor (sigma-70 family)
MASKQKGSQATMDGSVVETRVRGSGIKTTGNSKDKKPEEVETLQAYFNHVKKGTIASLDKTERDKIHNQLSQQVQAAISVAENHGLLCNMRFQPILEKMDPADRRKLSPAERNTIRQGKIARDRIIDLNMRLVTTIASKIHRKASKKVNKMDLIQEGYLGLVRAIEKFDSSKGCSFSTYAYRWILQAVLVSIQQEERLIKMDSNAISLVKRFYRGEYRPETEADTKKLNHLLMVYHYPMQDHEDRCGQYSNHPDPKTTEAAIQDQDDRLAAKDDIAALLVRIPLHESLALQGRYELGWFARYSGESRVTRLEARLRAWISAHGEPPECGGLLGPSISRSNAAEWVADGIRSLQALTC